MKTINLRRVTNTLNDNEMKMVKGGANVKVTDLELAEGGGGGNLSKPCGPPKEGCDGPHGAYVPASGGLPGGVCCLGPYEGWFNRYCYAVLRGMYQCHGT